MVDSTAKVTRFPDRETGVFFCREVLARTWFEPSVSIHGIQGGWSQSGVTCMIPLEVVLCSLDLPCCMACFSGLTSALSFDFVVLVPAMRLCLYACTSESLFVFLFFVARLLPRLVCVSLLACHPRRSDTLHIDMNINNSIRTCTLGSKSHIRSSASSPDAF